MLSDWQESKYLSLRFDGEGKIINVRGTSLLDYQDDLINGDLFAMPPAAKSVTKAIGKVEEPGFFS